MDLDHAIELRKGARFSARQWVELELYDCITFATSVYVACGVISKPIMPDYQIYSHGTKMIDLICNRIEATGGFIFVHDSAKQHGDFVTFTRGDRGHHVGIYLEGGFIAHCVRGRGVVIDSFVAPLSDHIHKIYRPKKWDSPNQK